MGLDTSTSCKEVEKSTHLGFAWFFGNAKSRDCWDGVLRRRGGLGKQRSLRRPVNIVSECVHSLSCGAVEQVHFKL